MSNHTRITELERQVKELLAIVSSNKITLTDPSDAKLSLVISINEGVYSVDKVTTTTHVESDNIINQ